MAAVGSLAASAKGPRPEASIGVAVVGGDEQARRVMDHAFKGTGEFLLCGFFPTAAAALAAIPSLCGVHLVLVELVLPGGCGIRCAMELRARRPELKTILITPSDEPLLLKRAFGAGISYYLIEPFGLRGCLTALRWVSCRLGGTWRPDAPPEADSSIAAGGHCEALTPCVLTEREEKFLTLLGKGYLCKEMADPLHLSVPGVKKMQHRVYQKLRVHKCADALRKWEELNGGCHRTQEL